MEESQTPSPVSENTKTAPVETPPLGSPEPLAKAAKPKFPLGAIIGVILFLLLAGTAAGFYVFKPQIMKLVTKPTPAGQSPLGGAQPSPTPTPNPNANWKTYTYDLEKYLIKYPADWYVHEHKIGGTVLGDQTIIDTSSTYTLVTPSVGGGEPGGVRSENPKGYITIDLESADKSATQTLKSFVQGARSNDGWTAYEDITIGGIAAVKRTSTLTDGVVEYAISHNNYVYDFITSAKDKNEQVTIEQILSTFKFTDSNSTPTPTCIPRPACLDATPRCMIAEPASGWCP